MGDGRYAAEADDIRAALTLYRRADMILIGMVALLATAHRAYSAEQPVEIDMGGEMRGEAVERLLDEAVIGDRGFARRRAA